MELPGHPTLIPLPDELRAERVVLRPYRPDDAAAVFAAIDESREHLRPWLPWVERHVTVEDTRDFCARAAANWLTREDLTIAIFAAGDGRFLGGTGLHRISWRDGTFEIGYWLRKSAEGRGYMREAVRTLTACAFEQLGARRVAITCDERNARSRRVAERLGFVPEGRLRNTILDPYGRPRNTLVFALIPEDYARVRAGWSPA